MPIGIMPANFAAVVPVKLSSKTQISLKSFFLNPNAFANLIYASGAGFGFS